MMASEATEKDLLEAVRKSLSEAGSLGHFKAELRASVMSILNKNAAHAVPASIPEETKVLNELIREYLAWNGYIYSEQILVTGFGCPHIQSADGLSRATYLSMKMDFNIRMGKHQGAYTEMAKESGDTSGKIRRENLAAKLGVMDDNKTQRIPLLYYILSAFQN